ncbi:MAG: hypothetical protein KF915_17405, partial [Polyangiaceae bacterium]|nr:hypothetical protein [Polyangiaceae bacterium]
MATPWSTAQAPLWWRLRAPITVLTLVAFCASLLSPLSVAAQAGAERSRALQDVSPTYDAPRQLDVRAPSDSSGDSLSAQPLDKQGAGQLQQSPASVDTSRLQGAVGATLPEPDDTVQPAALPTGDDKSGVTSKSISVPQGSGTVQGMGESFSAQLSTGIMTYAVPFTLPTARGNVDPALGLSYSSSGGHGNAGVGWTVGSAFIARQTDRGVPSYDDRPSWHPNQDRFVFNGGQELVPVCDVGPGLSCPGALPGEVMPSWSVGWQLQRPRVEGSFMRFFWSPNRRTWRVQSKSGQVLELGVPLDGSGYTGALETNPERPSEVYRWYVSREYDTQTATGTEAGAPVNTVLYRYQLDGESRYLTDIYDTTPTTAPTTTDLGRYAHHTRLTWAPRSDITRSYRSGWLIERALRLSRVDVTSARYGSEGREYVRRYQLEYDPAYHVSLLKSVQLKGRCRPVGGAARSVFEGPGGALPEPLGCVTEDLPKLSFGYSHVGPPTADGFEPFDTEVRRIQNSPLHSLDEALTDLFDVNRDGLPDVVVTAPGLYGGGYGWFENGAGGQLDTFSQAQAMALRGVLGANAATLQLTNPNLVALDLDGDGAANLLHMPVARSYGLYDFVQLSSGAYELQGREVTTASGLDVKIDFGRDALETQLMDVNSDGLVDVVVTTGTQLETFFNLGRLPGGDGQFGTGA